jgi:formate hydrogenlyase subunit 3/multisubunit Na+/H+ antiporter MnhD subunit
VPGAVALLGLATLAAGAVVMLLQDDLAHLVGYSVIADVGFCLLAVSAPGPVAWPELRVFLLLFALGKTAAVAFVFAAGSVFRTRRIAELDGWLRRAPLLGVAVVAILLATYGWPGSLPFEARQRLIELAVGPGLPRLVTVAAAWLSIAGWLRLLAIGLRRPAAQVLVAQGERPLVPARDRRPRTRPQLEAGDYRGAARELLIDVWLILARARRQAPLAYSLNRTPLAALLVLALAVLPLALGAGMGGLAAAATEPPIQVERSPTGG